MILVSVDSPRYASAGGSLQYSNYENGASYENFLCQKLFRLDLMWYMGEIAEDQPVTATTATDLMFWEKTFRFENFKILISDLYYSFTWLEDRYFR